MRIASAPAFGMSVGVQNCFVDSMTRRSAFDLCYEDQVSRDRVLCLRTTGELVDISKRARQQMSSSSENNRP